MFMLATSKFKGSQLILKMYQPVKDQSSVAAAQFCGVWRRTEREQDLSAVAAAMAVGCGMTLFLPTPLKLLSLSEAALDGWTTAPVMTVREKEAEGKGERGSEGSKEGPSQRCRDYRLKSPQWKITSS